MLSKSKKTVVVADEDDATILEPVSLQYKLPNPELLEWI
jgi:hypothetical protein